MLTCLFWFLVLKKENVFSQNWFHLHKIPILSYINSKPTTLMHMLTYPSIDHPNAHANSPIYLLVRPLTLLNYLNNPLFSPSYLLTYYPPIYLLTTWINQDLMYLLDLTHLAANTSLFVVLTRLIITKYDVEKKPNTCIGKNIPFIT